MRGRVLPPAASPGTDPGAGAGYHPTALATVGGYALPVPGFVPGRELGPADQRKRGGGGGGGRGRKARRGVATRP